MFLTDKLASLMLYRYLLDPLDNSVSDIWRIQTFVNTPTAFIEFASDPDTLDTSGFSKLHGRIETGDWQPVFQAGGIDPWVMQVRSETPEPPSLLLLVIALFGAGALRPKAFS